MMYPFVWGPSMLLLIPALILTLYAQSKVRGAYERFSRLRNMRGITGAEVARYILQRNGLGDVPVEMTPGQMSDHYDPRSRTVRLSQAVHSGTSVASVAIAAHECGHAIQHAESYAPLNFRSMFFPVASFGSKAAMPLIFLSLILGSGGTFLMDIGIILFSASVIFQLVTLPVEFNASSRALVQLNDNGFLAESEMDGAKKMLNAAALTYVAAAATAIMQLVRLLVLRGRRD